MSNSHKVKNNEEVLVVEPVVVGEQEPDTEVTGQAEPQGETALNEVEEVKLAEFERIIEQNLNGFLLVGRALKAIQAGRLYRAKFGKFEDYCRERWGLSDKYAYRLIDAYTCYDNLYRTLSPIGENRFPNNESQVRPLAALVPEKQVKVWKQVLNTCKGKPITAVKVEEAANKMLGQPGNKNAAQPKALARTLEQKLTKIGNLVTEALEEDESKLTIAGLKKILERIQKMIGAKK